jgi:hypothetical protein
LVFLTFTIALAKFASPAMETLSAKTVTALASIQLGKNPSPVKGIFHHS